MVRPLEYCEFRGEERSEGTFTDFDEVRRQIEERTAALAGTNKGIAKNPIILKVVSPHVVNLTLVDLPGIVKNPVGDQPKDIEDQVKDLIFHYISNEQAIILAVSSATEDIATSDSIQLAKKVDPRGERTLGVLTKLDRLENPTNANAVLDGTIIEVQLGIIGVVNRSQSDIDSNKSLTDAVLDEKKFFNMHYPRYRNKIGSTYLGKRLNQLLIGHIADSLPELSRRFEELQVETTNKLISLGEKVGEQNKLHRMMHISYTFVEDMKRAVKERGFSPSGGENFAVRIGHKFDIFDKEMEMTDDSMFLENLHIRVQNALQDSTNIERYPSIEVAFMTLVKEEIKKMEGPAVRCARSVHRVLNHLMETLLRMNPFERLNTMMRQAVRSVFAKQLNKTLEALKEHLDIEASMIAISDETFRRTLLVGRVENDFEEAEEALLEANRLQIANGRNVVRVAFGLVAAGGGNQQDGPQYVENVIRAYFNIVKSRFMDFVPKCVMWHLYECSVNKQITLAINKATEGKEEELMSEPESVTREREETERFLQNLQRASEKIEKYQFMAEENEIDE